MVCSYVISDYTSEKNVLPYTSAARTRSPNSTLAMALTSPDSIIKVSVPAKHEEGVADEMKVKREAGTGVPLTYVESALTDATQSPTL